MIYDEFYKWMVEEQGLSEKTSIQYSRRIEQITLDVNCPDRLTPEEVLNFVLSSGGSVPNHNHWVAALKKYSKYLDGLGTPNNFASLLSMKKVPKRLPKPLSKEQIDKICSVIPEDTLDGIRDRLIVELLYCGLRNNECASIKFQDFEDHQLRVVGKGDKERIIPINKTAWNYLVKYSNLRFGYSSFDEIRETHKDDPLLVSSENHPIYTRAIRRIISKYANKVGINAHPHMLRHSFATHLVDRGLNNLIALKDVMGHSKLDTTNQYVLVSEHNRKQLNLFHPREQE